MRKVISQNGDIFFDAESAVNGIYFTAVKKMGQVSLRSPKIFARIDENENIVCGEPKDLEGLENQHSHFYGVYKAIEKRYDKIFSIIALICIVFLVPIAFISESLSNCLLVGWMFFMACIISAGCIGFFIEKLKKNEEMLKVLRFHSAEHAVINAYYDLHRVPTLEEVRKYSNFSYGCGSLQKLTPSFWLCVMAVCRLFFSNPAYLIILITFVILWKPIFRQMKPFFMEFLVTDEPTDREYRVAIAGLQYSLQPIEDFNVEIEVIELDMDESNEEVSKKFSEEECKDCRSYKHCKRLNEERNKKDA